MKYCIAFFLFFFVLPVVAQNKLSLDVRGVVSNDDVGKKESGAKVAIVLNGSELASTTSASNGKYSLKADVPAGSVFYVVFTKSGMVSKRIEYSTKGINPEDLPPGNVLPVDASVGLFAQRPNIDFSFLDNEPVAKFFYDPKQMSVTYDKEQANAMRTKIDDMIAQAEKKEKENDLKYNAALKEADAKMAAKEYKAALAKYEEAVSYKPMEKYPSEQILALDALIQEQRKEELLNEQADAEYNNLITAADNLFKQKKYAEAQSKYEEALTKKSEQYPKDQIALIKAEQQKIENKKAYEEAIKSADMFFNQKSYKAAQDQYLAASKLIPSEQYPKDQLTKIGQLMKAQEDEAAKKQKYEDAVAAGDALFDQDKFADAKKKYQEALTYESAATYPAERIKMIDKKLAEQEAELEKAAKLEALLKQGDENFKAARYEEAKKNYTGVLTLEAENATAKSRLAEIDTKIAEQQEKAAQDAAFTKLVSEGDAADKASKLDEAKTKYEGALAIKQDPAVKTKLDAVLKKIGDKAALAEQKEQYDALIAEAAALLKQNDLAGARAKYTEALSVDETQQLPKDKIAEIDGKLEKEKLAADKKAAYDKLIDEAQAAFSANDLVLARSKYGEAKKADPSQTLPDTKIKEIDALIAENKADKEKAEKYQALVEEGLALMSTSKLTEAKAKFTEAQKVDPAQTLPAEKISEIDALIAKNAAHKEAQQKAEKYLATIQEAAQLLENKKLQEARAKYQEAKKTDPEQTLPDEKIAEIDALIAEQKAASEQQAQIEKLLTDGTRAMNGKDLVTAKTKFEEVLSIDAKNDVATEKLAEVNKQLAAQKSSAEKEALFAELKKDGFALAEAQKYNEAKQKLNEALSIKDDSAVKAKIKEIDALVAEQDSQKQKEEAYQNALTKASSLESAKNLEAAIAAYQEAGRIKPSEQLPKDKVSELTQQLNQLAGQQETDAKYEAAMQAGDKYMADKNYLKAIEEYNRALSVKPDESLPVTRAKQAEELIAAQNTLEKDAQYEKIITAARQRIDEKDYAKATELLGRAEQLRPEDPRPAKMREEISRLQAQEKEYTAKMKQAADLEQKSDFEAAIAAYEAAKLLKPAASEPQVRIDAIQSKMATQKEDADKEKMFAEYVKKGKDAYDSKEYTPALVAYKNAHSLKPENKEVNDRISEIQQILDNLANAAKKDAQKEKEIQKLIAEADVMFENQQWLQAKSAYEKVLAKDPSNGYAAQRRDESIERDKYDTKLRLDEEYNKIIRVADEAFAAADYEKATSYYQRALNVRNSDPYPKSQLEKIKAIQDPAFVENEKLKPLGIPVENSIHDGGALLAEAELMRKNAEKQKVQNAQNEIKEEENDRSRQKYQQSVETTQEIEQVLSDVSEKERQSAIDQQKNTSKLEQNERERQEAERQNAVYKNTQTLNTNEKLTVVNREVDDERGKNADDRYMTNAEKVDREQQTQQQAEREKNLQFRDNSLQSKEKINNVVQQVEVNNDDLASREESARKIREEEQQKAAGDRNASDRQYDNAQQNRDVILQTESELNSKNENGYTVPVATSTEIHKAEYERAQSEANARTAKEGLAREADQEFARIENAGSAENLDYLERRMRTNGELDENAKALESEEQQNYDKNMRKYLANREEIEQKKTLAESEAAYPEAKTNASSTAIRDLTQAEADQNKARSEKAHQGVLSSQQTIDDTKKKEAADESNLIDRQNSLRESLSENEKAMREKNEAAAKAKKDDQLNNQQAINNVDRNSKPEAKARVKNSLGEEYPEGVSQETFVQNDDNGILKAIVTRRVVVKDGHGDVYVRTQLSNATTYSKNGNAITEYQWVRETQDASLVRNY